MLQKWADYLVSQVAYDPDRLIFKAVRHQDTGDGIGPAMMVGRMTMASDIKNGKSHITAYDAGTSWKKGQKIHAFLLDGEPFLRTDNNKVRLDFLGDISELPGYESELEQASLDSSEPKSAPLPPAAPPSPSPKPAAPSPKPAAPSPKPAAPSPKPAAPTAPAPKPATPITPPPSPSPKPTTPIGTAYNKLPVPEKTQSAQPDSKTTGQHDVDQTRKNPTQQDDAKPKPKKSNPDKKPSNKKPKDAAPDPDNTPEITAYCTKCKEKRPIADAQNTVLKNGRHAVKGRCPECSCSVFRFVKTPSGAKQ